MHNVADIKHTHTKKMGIFERFLAGSMHQAIREERGGVSILRGMDILMWPLGAGGSTDQSDKDSLSGCESESRHRTRTQDPSVGLSWPLALTMANGGLALDQCTERQGSPSLPFHWARIGRDAARSHVVEPSTLPLSHPVGDSCSANEPGDTTLPLPCRKDGQQLYLCGGGRGKSVMIRLWMSEPCKQHRQILSELSSSSYDGLWKPEPHRWTALCFQLKTFFSIRVSSLPSYEVVNMLCLLGVGVELTRHVNIRGWHLSNTCFESFVFRNTSYLIASI